MSCPFTSSSGPTASATSAGDVAKCPFMSASASAAPAESAPAAPAAHAPGAVCPLGFGTSRGPRLSSLHCPVCRGLLHEAHMAAQCKHTFCQACINKARDCPVCGMDIQSTEPNHELSDLVDTFLDTHSKSPELVAAQADLGPLPDNSAASFFMAQGLKSLAGGNVHAALHRLSRCRDALLAAAAAAAAAAGADGSSDDTNVVVMAAEPAGLQQDEEEGIEQRETSAAGSNTAGEAAVAAVAAAEAQQPAAEQQQQQQTANETASRAAAASACQLAACCGCLADCYLRLGEPTQAEQLYQEAIASVQQHAESDAEAAHATSVSLNKLGDLRYMQQELQAAKGLYRQALQLRQLCCGPLSAGQAGPGEQLELASSLIKLADACKALGESDEAEQLLRRAQGVCFEVKLQQADLPPAVGRKLQLLLDVLHAQAGSAEAC